LFARELVPQMAVTVVHSIEGRGKTTKEGK